MNPTLLEQYKNLSWDRLLMHRLGEAGSLDNAKPALDRAKFFLDKLLDNRVLSVLPPNATPETELYTQNFLSFLQNQVLGYSDVSQRDRVVSDIKNEVGSLLNILGKYSNYFDVLPGDSSAVTNLDGKISELKNTLQAEIAESLKLRQTFTGSTSLVQQAIGVSEDIISRKAEIEGALAKVNEFNKANEETIKILLQKNATSFSEKAEEHNSYSKRKIPVSRWLIAGGLLGIIDLGIVYLFPASSDITLGSAILHVTALIVPSYFAILFVNQFLLQRRLYEAYKFKDISLQTMIMLRKEFAQDHEARRELLQRSMAVIFSEPATSSTGGKYDKQLISEILKLLADKHQL